MFLGRVIVPARGMIASGMHAHAPKVGALGTSTCPSARGMMPCLLDAESAKSTPAQVTTLEVYLCNDVRS